MEQKQAEGVSVNELWGMLVKHIWAVLLAAVLFAAALILLFAFVVNPLGRSYSMEFYLTYPGSDLLKYPDGSSFSYRELISLEALASVKASDERFGSVDTVKMVQEDGISITAAYLDAEGEYKLTGRGRIV